MKWRFDPVNTSGQFARTTRTVVVVFPVLRVIFLLVSICVTTFEKDCVCESMWKAKLIDQEKMYCFFVLQ